MRTSIYKVFPRLTLPNRQWPNNILTTAPEWCSIDLRDGNQALPKPISMDKKIRLFSYLVTLGFKQIEVGTPGRSTEDNLFVRRLIQDNLIPDGVTIQVTTQLKKQAIDTTLDSVKGCKRVIINLCQSTPCSISKDIFDMNHEQFMTHIVSNVIYAKEKATQTLDSGTYQWAFSAEGFNTTEPDLLVSLCEQVIESIKPEENNNLYLTFIAAVETDLPNYFADQIEFFISQLRKHPNIIFGVQTHNDRGGAVASSELALLAGIGRVEGCLLGHGERAGACCLLTLALNLYTHGINIELDFSNVSQMVSVFEHCTGIAVSPRHPYAGELVFTAFSAPHQFAIRESYSADSLQDKKYWQVPYLPMDPNDLGRGNDDVIRLNALSGRSGIAYVMDKSHGYKLPKNMQHEFSLFIKKQAVSLGAEITSEQVWGYFTEHYFKGQKTLELTSVTFNNDGSDKRLTFKGNVLYNNEKHSIEGHGTEALAIVIASLKNKFDLNFDVIDYHQHALGYGSTATVVSYLQIRDQKNESYWGVGVDSDTTLATLDALFCALNRKMDMNND